MNSEDSIREEQISKENSNKTIFLTLSIGIIFVLILGSIIFLFTRKKQAKPVNYTNPFSIQPQTTVSQNPFAKPTTVFQNPFVQSQRQTTNKSYQNPFGGGQ